jgi:hypothetical protein
MRVTITKELEDWWADPEDWATMTDDEVLELMREDVLAVIEDATWTVERTPSEARA